MINPPLASTAVGVVPVERSGMARGVNSTFRQVGIATGIAALGSIFSHQVTDAARPALAGKVPDQALDGLTAALSGGQVSAAAEGAQKAATAGGGQGAGQKAYDLVNQVGTSSVVDALNHIVLIAAVVALVAGVLCLVLIRQKDFVVRGGPPPPGRVGRAGGGDLLSRRRATPDRAGSARSPARGPSARSPRGSRRCARRSSAA